MFRSVRTRERKHMRHWWQWALLSFFVLIALGAGFGTYKYYATQGNIHEEGPGELPQVEDEDEDPFNVLLVGSDSREGLTEEEQLDLGAAAVGGQRADTLILAHIDPAANQVTMVQFPRDLYVSILDDGEGRINTALEGGPRHLVRTIENLSGLAINKYAQVNIAGFRDLVDAIGGVNVCIAEPIPFDPATGIEITEEEVGMVHFDGDRAIRFVRSRRFATGDFERIQNQQKFLAAAIDKITSVGTLFRPDRILELLDVAGENLSTDANTTINGLRKLADRFRAFDPEHYEAYTVPNEGTTSVNGASVVAPDEEAMEILFEAIEANESPAEYDGVPDVDPTTVRVGVYNGVFDTSLLEGVAATAAEELKAATDTGSGPVEIVEVANAKRGNFKRTQIRYTAETATMGELLAAAIPPAEAVEVDRLPTGLDVQVIVADDFATKQLVQILPIPIPPPSDPPPECRR